MSPERDARAEILAALPEWEGHKGVPIPEHLLDQLANLATFLDGLRTVGFAYASCTWCSLMLPVREEARCPVCRSLVSRAGRRRFARPEVLGVKVPDGGLSSEERDAVLAKYAEVVAEGELDRLFEAMARSRGAPKN